LLEVGDFLVEKIEIRNEFSAAFKQDVLSLHLLLSLNLLYLGLILFKELPESFFRVLFPKIAVFL
jgi:hypothetical protein